MCILKYIKGVLGKGILYEYKVQTWVITYSKSILDQLSC